MMSFMTKKKRFKFQVDFELQELSSVPFVSGILYAKVRLIDGGNFLTQSEREEVNNHCVVWKSRFNFQCKITANAQTGYLDPCMRRISVRRELKGGKASLKLGYVDLNLSEFAGSGIQSRKLLLNGYDTKHRQDNSTLEIAIDMTLVSGDPIYKVPTKPHTCTLQADITAADCQDPHPAGPLDDNSESSSGFGSLTRKEKTTDNLEPEPNQDFIKSHSRNDSYASQHSRGSTGYSSQQHSRQSSLGNDNPSHTRSPSAGSALQYDLKRTKVKDDSIKGRRVDDTRVDPEDLVNDLLSRTDFGFTEQNESTGLELIVDKDGTTALR